MDVVKEDMWVVCISKEDSVRWRQMIRYGDLQREKL